VQRQCKMSKVRIVSYLMLCNYGIVGIMHQFYVQRWYMGYASGDTKQLLGLHVSYSTIVYCRPPRFGCGPRKNITQNQPHFSHMMMWQYWLGKTKPKKVFKSIRNAFNKLLQNFKKFSEFSTD